MINPCSCCLSLQNGTRIVATVQIIGSIVAIIYLILGVISVIKKSEELGEEFPMKSIGWSSFAILMAILALILGIILQIGANQKNAQKCQIWWYTMYLMFVIQILSSLMYAINMGFTPEPISSILLNIYFLWVVYAFLEEIRVKALPSDNEKKEIP